MHKYLRPLIAAALVTLTTLAPAAPYDDTPGPRPVSTLLTTWHYPDNSRDVPLLLCFPKDLAPNEKLPVILFSHGLGGTCTSYQPYGTHWASYGYIVLFPQHHGSDSGVIGHGMAQMLMGLNDTQPFLDRVKDIHFCIDQLEQLDAAKLPDPAFTPLAHHLDLANIGMSGHSFGALTTQALIGENYPLDKDHQLPDPRIKAAIVMSGSGSKSPNQAAAFAPIHIPAFYLTGTEDKIGNVGAAQRRTPFDFSTSPDTYLLTFTGGTHMTFGPRQHALGGANIDTFQSFIRQSTTAFWNATLKHDPTAKSWLTTTFPKDLATTGTFESKK